MKRFLREPLLHFVLLGAGLFVVSGWLSGPGGVEPDSIVVSRGQVEHLALGFERTWMRPPTDDELLGLVRDRVREEVYVREALALGLDRDDPVIRRRLRQKLEFITDDVAQLAEPTEAELASFLAAHPERFATPPRLGLSHVYFDTETRDADPHGGLQALAERWNQADTPIDPEAEGASFLLPRTFDDVSTAELESLFGADFAEGLTALTPGTWQGPIRSGYGEHLVLIRKREPARVPSLDEVRTAVRQAWNEDRRRAANEAVYRGLLERYSVTIEGVDPAETMRDAPR